MTRRIALPSTVRPITDLARRQQSDHSQPSEFRPKAQYSNPRSFLKVQHVSVPPTSRYSQGANTSKELSDKIAEPGLSHNERAEYRCLLAKHLEEAGKYEAARGALEEIWQRVGDRPILDGLNQLTAASVLLRAGTLTGWIGSTQQIRGSQSTAKMLISESIELFLLLKQPERVAEAETELAYCYWREGAFAEARAILHSALNKLSDVAGDLKAVVLLRAAIVEWSANRFHDALGVLTEALPLFERSTNAVLKGKFHHALGFVLRNLGDGYMEQAPIEYDAARIYFEQAGLTRYEACVENNLGHMLGIIGKFAEAHDHLDRAQVLFTRLRDTVNLAHVNETRARVLLWEKRVVEAEKAVRAAVKAFHQGDERSFLAKALITHGLALARLCRPEKARSSLEQAIEIAQQSGDLESAGQAALVILEQLNSYLTSDDIYATIGRAEQFFKNTEDVSTLKRLIACSNRALSMIYASPRFPATVDWNKFSLKRAVLSYEEHFVKLALNDAQGAVTHAARLLGFKHHQTLLALLNGRHQNLRQGSTTIKPRKRSIIRRRETKHKTRKPAASTNVLRILHVEDNQIVADAVRDTLELEGWQVETCLDGALGLEKIAGPAHYDVFLLDYDLPRVSGIELVRKARSLDHRRRTPIIVLSAALGEAAAREAGANVFLHKPEDIRSLVGTIGDLVSLGRN